MLSKLGNATYGVEVSVIVTFILIYLANCEFVELQMVYFNSVSLMKP